MKTTIVPAQITTIEDTIAGNLTLSQILLLIAPVFFSALLFVVLPPFFKINYLKIFLALIIAIPAVMLSIRIKGVIVFHTIRSLISYKLKPRIYLSTLPPTVCRSCGYEVLKEEINEEQKAIQHRITEPELGERELIELSLMLPLRTLSFYKDRKGNMNAIIE